MRVAALALVLVIASAVVLIFANTLNSWVLGGLIGGLAALLISIPISLIIFTTLARRNDERIYAQMMMQPEEDHTYYQQGYEESDSYDQYDEYSEVYEAEAYYLPEDEEEHELPRGRRQPQPEIRSLPAAGQSYASSSRRTRDLASEYERNREATVHRQGQQTGHQRNPRSPYTTRSLRSQQQAAALRAARQEAAQGQQGSERFTTGPMKRPTTTRNLPPQSIQFQHGRLKEESGKQQAFPENDYNAKRSPGADNARPREAETDQLLGRYPITGAIRQNPETGQIGRNPQLDELFRGRDATTGNLRNPLVRRAPYLYEDDALNDEFSQQLDQPLKRRASLYQLSDGEGK